MSEYFAEASAVIPARPDVVYGVLSDYMEGHQAILPRQFFKEMKVIEGGHGAGTVIEVHTEVYGSKQVFNMTVSEPEPGRVLQESDPAIGITTTFTVDPAEGGTRSKVTIAVHGKTSGGIRGLLEKIMNPPIMRRMFKTELRLIADYAQQAQAASPSIS